MRQQTNKEGSKPSPQPVKAKPSLKLLFTFLSARDAVILLLPALLLSILVGLVPAIMSKAIGNSFDTFTSYNLSALPSSQVPSSEKREFLHKVLKTVYILLALAGGTFVVSTVSVSVWVCLGEKIAGRMRITIFDEIVGKKMCWFDTGMGLGPEESENQDSDSGEVSPAGMMAKVARESDDVRIAVARQLGDVVQHMTTAIASLALALYSSWSLTLVILVSIPMILVLTVVTELGAAPSLQLERLSTAKATGMVERVVQSINTVKAFNAQHKETKRFGAELQDGCKAYRKTLFWWATRFGITGGLVFAMFVQGFWYGSHLVQKGQLTSGQVMTVFMASLLVSGKLNEIVQALSYIEKGKVGAANIINLINSSDTTPSHIQTEEVSSKRKSGSTSSLRSSAMTLEKSSEGRNSYPPKSPFSDESEPSTFQTLEYDYRKARAVPMSIEAIPHSPAVVSPHKLSHSVSYRAPKTTRPNRVQGLRRIAPSSCQGEVHLRNVSFAYPSRPTHPVLRNASLYFPPAEMTYVVGGSGSGKSTVAQLLLRLYEPSEGTIQIDDQTIEYLDPTWCRQHIAAVSQSPIIFDMSIHDNVALGLVGLPSSSAQPLPIVSREEVESACRTALLHDFIRDLPDGYDTMLGSKGTSLSGGQRQRLAIARAKLRDPSILILDEATSALDPTSRLLVHEAVKTWRRGKTTIVITHDLSQIEQDDFLYLLEDGVVAQQGYRSDLEDRAGPFQRMAATQREGRGVNHDSEEDFVEFISDPIPDSALEISTSRGARIDRGSKSYTGHRSFLGWEKEAGIVSEHLSFLISQKHEPRHSHLKPLRLAERQEMQNYYEDAEALRATGASVRARRGEKPIRRNWDQLNAMLATNPQDSLSTGDQPNETKGEQQEVPTAKQVAKILWATIPSRALLVFGMTLCVVAGTMTPIFSYILAELLATMGKTGQGAAVLKWSLLVLLIALLEGIFSFSRFLLMETIADDWIYRMRLTTYNNVVMQDRSWFDEPANSPEKICQSIVKDADDARNLVGQIIGQLSLVVSMVGLGIIWALVVGWQLTLVGVAFAPIFIVAMFYQSRIIDFYEGRNKIKREKVSEAFYAMLSNIRSIRSMGLEAVFGASYIEAVSEAQRCGMQSSIFSGFGHGMSDALTYIAEALMFFTGAKLMMAGSYDFKRMIQVFNLIIFSVTFAAQMLTFLPGLSKSMKALVDLDRLLKLSLVTQESQGQLTPQIEGKISFYDVRFSYPLRPDVQVLTETSLVIDRGECVAIVGSSGCGKSTIAALLQRLYEPCEGTILIDETPLQLISTNWLREHVSVVSQSPNVFEMTIAQNIAYGGNTKVYEECPTDKMTIDESTQSVVKSAARSVNMSDFIESLPKGYETMVGGGDSSKLSGGQAQRLAIARALMRVRSKILILDECTSALDVQNQHAIVETLMNPNSEIRKRRMTTLVITHNVDMMRKCDRILVLKEGQVAEQGTYSNLIARRGGYFASLARGGEWTG